MLHMAQMAVPEIEAALRADAGAITHASAQLDLAVMAETAEMLPRTRSSQASQAEEPAETAAAAEAAAETAAAQSETPEA